MKTDSAAIYLSAIENDGKVNVGYVFLFKILRIFWVELGTMTLFAAVAAYATRGDVDGMVKVLTAYGTAVGIVSAATFVTALAGVAAFLWGDSHAAPGTTTIEKSEKSTVSVAPDKPPK